VPTFSSGVRGAGKDLWHPPAGAESGSGSPQWYIVWAPSSTTARRTITHGCSSGPAGSASSP